MIKISGLTKTYISQNKKKCRALDSVDLILPESGLVFVVGKSGSGKSTLLNMIGGLDSFDSGEITVFGNSLSKFTVSEYNAYRSNFVSLVFQDYHLIDEFTVHENITMLCSEYNEHLLQKALTVAGIEHIQDKYPTELSGGQRQRVAIARAVIKEPKILLCDEPTGNLDKKTSKQIYPLLKDLSKDRLVIVVTHNLNEAEKYGDRIIELSDGKLIKDISRNPSSDDTLRFDGKTAVIPRRKKMYNKELSSLNQALSSGQVEEIRINDEGFLPTEIEYKENKQPLFLKRISKKNLRKIFVSFSLTKKRQSITMIIICALMLGVFAVLQSFLTFDEGVVISQKIQGETAIAIGSGHSLHPQHIYEDVEGIKNYKLYNDTIIQTSDYGNSYEDAARLSFTQNFSHFFIHESYGLLITDYNYLADKYGDAKGELQLVAGSFKGVMDGTSVLITDYLADSIIFHEVYEGTNRYLSYDSLITDFKPDNVNVSCRIAGIIDTDYMNRYQTLLQPFFGEDGNIIDDLSNLHSIGYGGLHAKIDDTSAYVEFVDEVILYLGVTYSFNKNYAQALDSSTHTYVRLNNVYFETSRASYKSHDVSCIKLHNPDYTGRELADDEIAIPYTLFNRAFGTYYTKTTLNRYNASGNKRTITLTRYEGGSPSGKVLYSREFKVALITDDLIVVNRANFSWLREQEFKPIGLYLMGIEDEQEIIDFVTENEFRLICLEQEGIDKVYTAFNIFNALFTFLQVVMIVLISFYLIASAISDVKSNSYKIGVIKALGGTNANVSGIFFLKTIAIGLISCIASVVIAIAFIELSNSFLLTAVKRLFNIGLGGITIVRILPGYLLIDALAMLAVSVISALVTVMMMKRVKPVEILRSRD